DSCSSEPTRTTLRISPICVASVTAVIVAEAPGPSRPRLQPVSEQVPCEGVMEISFVRYEVSETLTTFTSSAATEDAFVTLTVQVILRPSATVVGRAVLLIFRSTIGAGGSGGDTGGGSGCVGGVGGSGGSGGTGVGGVVIRVLVKVQTTKSPFATAPSTFVPGTDTSTAPFRVQVTVDS